MKFKKKLYFRLNVTMQFVSCLWMLSMKKYIYSFGSGLYCLHSCQPWLCFIELSSFFHLVCEFICYGYDLGKFNFYCTSKFLKFWKVQYKYWWNFYFFKQVSPTRCNWNYCKAIKDGRLVPVIYAWWEHRQHSFPWRYARSRKQTDI